VLVVGLTVVLEPVTEMFPGSSARESAPVTLQVSVTDELGGAFDGLAVREAMLGGPMQCPAEQMRPVPQEVPFPFAVVSVQVPGTIGEVQATTPSMHGFVG
jgi:hypothetical protein